MLTDAIASLTRTTTDNKNVARVQSYLKDDYYLSPPKAKRAHLSKYHCEKLLNKEKPSNTNNLNDIAKRLEEEIIPPNIHYLNEIFGSPDVENINNEPAVSYQKEAEAKYLLNLRAKSENDNQINREFATTVDKCNHLQKADLGDNALRHIRQYLGNLNSKSVYEGRYNREYREKIATTDKMSLSRTPSKYDSEESSSIEDNKRKRWGKDEEENEKKIKKAGRTHKKDKEECNLQTVMKNMMIDIKTLREDQKEYREDIAKLKKENKNIKKDNVALRQEIEKIKEKVIILENNNSEILVTTFFYFFFSLATTYFTLI
ncbi:hypothetical protein FQA39_LY02229 [Lamprigera yunnana]|nr:hypothetical protein FQA39_LY02229 [Lamprigera yunnana]